MFCQTLTTSAEIFHASCLPQVEFFGGKMSSTKFVLAMLQAFEKLQNLAAKLSEDSVLTEHVQASQLLVLTRLHMCCPQRSHSLQAQATGAKPNFCFTLMATPSCCRSGQWPRWALELRAGRLFCTLNDPTQAPRPCGNTDPNPNTEDRS